MAIKINTGNSVPLSQHKEPAFSRPLMRVRPPETVAVPIFDFGLGHMLPIPRVGETVAKNSMLARSKNNAAWVVSPVSGKLQCIERTEHPALGSILCAYIKLRDNIPPLETKGHNPGAMTSAGVIQAARNACILDEADGLPLYYKLQCAVRDKIQFVVADAVDDTPYISSSLKTVSEYGDLCADGTGFVLKALDGGKAVLAAYDPGDLNMDVILENFGFITTVRVDGGYPAWHRFEREHCGGKPYLRIGVQAAKALSAAVRDGLPQTETILTVSGDCVANPVNVIAPIGTPISYILSEVGLKKPPRHLILGDTMRGIDCPITDAPIFPGIRGITAMSELPRPARAICISCGRCVDVCPLRLFPSEAWRLYERGQKKEAAAFGAAKCDGCGACSAVCPSGIELAEMMLSLQ